MIRRTRPGLGIRGSGVPDFRVSPESMSSQPPALAVGAAYDSLLQSALRQFFERATLDTEITPSVSSDGRLAIEPSANPAALIVRWFGTRYTLRVPGRWVFTAHEVRLAQAIGAVLAARFSAILNPRIIAERGDLFRGAIEDRYVGAFLDPRPYAIDRGRHVPTASPRSSNCSGWPRSPAMRTDRFRRAFSCSAPPRIRVVPEPRSPIRRPRTPSR